MLQILPQSQGYILGVKATGKFTNQDYREFLLPRLADLIKEHGRVRLLLYLNDDFQIGEPEALAIDPFGREHKDTFEKIAVVGASWWLSLKMKLVIPLLGGQVRNFSRSQLSDAWAWIKG